jgi:hypothetical protein
MRKALAALILLLGLASAALAQVALTKPIPEGPNVFNATASATFTTGTATATLTGASGKFTYICGFVVTSAGTTTATLGDITITGTITGTLNFEYAFVSSGQGILGIAFGPGCIQSSAKNTSIVVNVPAGGAGTAGAVTAWGYTN